MMQNNKCKRVNVKYNSTRKILIMNTPVIGFMNYEKLNGMDIYYNHNDCINSLENKYQSFRECHFLSLAS